MHQIDDNRDNTVEVIIVAATLKSTGEAATSWKTCFLATKRMKVTPSGLFFQNGEKILRPTVGANPSEPKSCGNESRIHDYLVSAKPSDTK